MATPAGVGAVGIVRLSGPECGRIAVELIGRRPRPREATLAKVRDGAGRTLDHGLALFFPAPRSYTGEDVLELHLHGGRRLLEIVVARCLELGARPAEPGEFTRRAFFHGKLDLLSAEAVADLVSAESAGAVRLAAAQLEGRFQALVGKARAVLLETIAGLAAAADYPEDVAADPAARERLRELGREVAHVVRAGEAGRVVREGASVVLLGPPNAGKSSLFNALLGQPRAIVTPVPGTTRDTVAEVVERRGLRVRLVDTAGVRESADPVERLGVERAWEAALGADLVLWVEEAWAPQARVPAEIAARPHLVVAQKGDRVGEGPAWADVVVSAWTGAGVEELWEAALRRFPEPEDVPTANARHLGLLREVADHLAFAGHEPWDVVLAEAEAALEAVLRLTGEAASATLVDEIFARFCLGK